MFHEIEMCLPPRLQRLFGGHHEALRRSRVVVTAILCHLGKIEEIRDIWLKEDLINGYHKICIEL